MSYKHHTGFTLIEFLIAAFLLMIVTLGALSLVTQTNARLMELAEAEELEHRRSVIFDNIRHDFDQAGMRILSPQLRVNSQEAVFLTSTPHYQTEALGLCRKLTNDANERTSAARGMYAAGWLQFKPQRVGSGIIGFTGSDDSLIGLQFVPDETTGGGELRYYKEANGITVSNSPIDSAHLPGDYYRLLVEGEKPIITVKVYRIKQAQLPVLLATFANEPANYPYRPAAQLSKADAAVENIVMSGTATAIVRTGQPLLPIDSDVGPTRLTQVVNVNAPSGVFQSLSLLQGDINVDMTRTAFSIDDSFAAFGSDTLYLRHPCNGRYKLGDAIMLIDDTGAQQRSVTLTVNAFSAALPCTPNTPVSLGRADFDKPAWGRMITPPSDYDPAFLEDTTQVIKILPPVTYRLNRVTETLIRVEGKRETAIAFGVVDFSVVPRVLNGTTSYEIKCILRRENFATQVGGDDNGYLTMSFTAAPSGLNREYEYQKLGDPTE